MPLIVRYPSLARAGGTASELGSSTDIAPTVMDLAGLPIPSHMQGKSMKKALDGVTVAHGRTGVLTEYYAHDLPMPWALDADYKSIRTRTHKYIHWIQHPEYDELYDIANDPFEMKNIALDPTNKDLLANMKKQLMALIPESISLQV